MVFSILGALHRYAVLAMGQLLLQYIVAIYTVQGVKLMARNGCLDMPTRKAYVGNGKIAISTRSTANLAAWVVPVAKASTWPVADNGHMV